MTPEQERGAEAFSVERTYGDRAYSHVAERIGAYMLKAVRESKYRSNWAQPDGDYEAALDSFAMGAAATATA